MILFRRPVDIVVQMSQIVGLRLKLKHQRDNYRLIMTSLLRSSKNIVEVLTIDHQKI